MAGAAAAAATPAAAAAPHERLAGCRWPLIEDAVPILGPLLPAGVTQLEVQGMVEGLPHVLSQLHSLHWEVNPQHYYAVQPGDSWQTGECWHWVVPAATWEAICMVSAGGAQGPVLRCAILCSGPCIQGPG